LENKDNRELQLALSVVQIALVCTASAPLPDMLNLAYNSSFPEIESYYLQRSAPLSQNYVQKTRIKDQMSYYFLYRIIKLSFPWRVKDVLP